MSYQAADRKALAAEYFKVTGDAVSENDPIVTGTLFFSHKLAESAATAAQEIREAGRDAAKELREASRTIALEAGEAVAQANQSTAAAEGTIAVLVEHRAQHLKAVEAQMLKCVKIVQKTQSSANGLSHVHIKYAVAGAIAGGIALAGVFYFGVEKVSERERQAAIGRAFSRALPTLEPKLRQQLLEHFEKSR